VTMNLPGKFHKLFLEQGLPSNAEQRRPRLIVLSATLQLSVGIFNRIPQHAKLIVLFAILIWPSLCLNLIISLKNTRKMW